MKHSKKIGLSFGLTSGVITTLGLMTGLHSGTNSELAVLGGIITIAIADSFSDAFGIHVSEESENHHTTGEIWEATIFTFIFKFIFSISFIVPLLLFPLSKAIFLSIIWGFFLLSSYSIYLARKQKQNIWHVLTEHLLIAGVVIFCTHYCGIFIAKYFG